MIKRAISLVLVLMVLTSCSLINLAQDLIAPGAETTPTYTLTSTEQPTPSFTPSITPTFTPSPTPTPILPVLFNTPFPTQSGLIEAKSFVNYREMVRWGLGEILSSTWSPDGSKIFLNTRTGFYLYDYPGLNLISSIPHNEVSYPAISSNGKWLAVVNGTTLEIWDLQSFSLSSEITVPPLSLGLIFEEERGILTGWFRENDYSPLIQIVIDPMSEKTILNKSFPELKSRNLIISSNFRYAVNRLTDSVYYVWDLIENVQVYETKFSGEIFKHSVAAVISNDGKHLVLSGGRFFDLNSSIPVNVFNIPEDNEYNLYDMGDGIFISYNEFTGDMKVVHPYKGIVKQSKEKISLPISIDQNGLRFIDGKGKIFQIAEDQSNQKIDQIGDFLLSCCKISSQATYLAGWVGNTLNLYSGIDGSLIKGTLLEGENSNDILLFSPLEDKLVRLNFSESTVEIFSLPDLSKIFSIPLNPIKLEQKYWFITPSISPDGSYLAISGFTLDALVIINLNSGKKSLSVKGNYMGCIFHPSGILAVRYSDYVGREYILKIDPVDGKEVGRISGDQFVAIAPDNKNLIVVTHSGNAIKDWDTGIVTVVSVLKGKEDVIRSLGAVSTFDFSDLWLWIDMVQNQNRYYVSFGGVFQIFESAP